jgi:hypothetical protein
MLERDSMRPYLRRRHRMLPQATMARVLCVVVALAMLVGVMQARARYFYCESCGLSATDPCAQGAVRRSPCPLASLDRPPFDCCQVITMPAMPEGARSVEPAVPAPGLLSVLPACVRAAESSSSQGARTPWRDEHWRGPPKSLRERRTQWMVFLT